MQSKTETDNTKNKDIRWCAWIGKVSGSQAQIKQAIASFDA